MQFSILSLFPEYFKTPLQCSLINRAQEAGLISIQLLSLREFGEGHYRATDDRPFGGGPGMVMRPTILEQAFLKLVGGEQALQELECNVQFFRANRCKPSSASGLPHVIYLSPQGKPLDHLFCQQMATSNQHIALLCGHYEGVDERVIEAFVHEEVSVGDFVLTGGEPAALLFLDAVSRFIPGVIGQPASVHGDTFGASIELVPGGLKAPVYTRPLVWREKEVPSVLVSGHHAEIARWRCQQSTKRTLQRRPDLMQTGLGVSKKRLIYVVLLHHSVTDRHGKEVTTAVTNLDIHDIARSCKTYGVRQFFIVNPAPEQHRLVNAILEHWDKEVSQVYHPSRAEALRLVRLVSRFEEAFNEICFEVGPSVRPFVVMPDAKELEGAWSYRELRWKLETGGLPGDDESSRRPLIVVFGTGWGISQLFYPHVDRVLKPIRAQEVSVQNYNHLSVRAAAAAVLDRILGERES